MFNSIKKAREEVKASNQTMRDTITMRAKGQFKPDPIPDNFYNRPWGTFQIHHQDENSWIKTLTINPGQQLSLQYHFLRKEFWTVIAGRGEIYHYNQWSPIYPCFHTVIEAKQIHSARNTGTIPLVIAEIALGKPLENDIIRLEDLYGRDGPIPISS